MLWGGHWAHSQVKSVEIGLDFRVNRTEIDTAFADNVLKLRQLSSLLEELSSDPTIKIHSISFRGTASPEGYDHLNRNLAMERMRAIEEIVREKIPVPDSLITYDDAYMPWDRLIVMIEKSDVPYRDKALEIMKGEDQIVRLQTLEGGKVWRDLINRFYSRVRNASVAFVTEKPAPAKAPAVVRDTLAPADTIAPADTLQPKDTLKPAPVVIVPAKPQPQPKKWSRKLYVKTNAVGLGLAIANLGLEVDICKHLSFHLPAYYSAWNYGKETLKFRTLMTQPELRFWFSKKNDGFFLGPHFGIGSYNVAFDGDYRIQDHDGITPAIGGGLSLGYRFPISKDNHWKLEISVGGGAYSLWNDYFRNYKNGLLVGNEGKWYFGPDMASISFMYMFDLKRKNKEDGR